jgi:large subunit ribosomal protein L32
MPGGAVPKKKESYTRQGYRRSHLKLTAPQLVACEHCHQPKRPQHVCPTCGRYRGCIVVDVAARDRKRHE